ncbi:MAG: winged helix-turn-helix transcriptional regulator [Aliivibrio sp.]|uniref:PfkB family carbohydrate kinase n=1 Tax=Aliivibrio sp. TaxID=1872443 RepID=UPI001A4EA512|nr:winged helix-turn-helix transcriptional regulator [Aliivibrio sp.]
MTERELEILSILKQNPLISQQDIAEKLDISRSAVAGHIMNLTHKGVIKGKGYIFSDNKYAVVIGGSNMDILGRPAGDFRLCDSNVGHVTCSPGGVGRNIAENLARLGTDTRLISAVAKDAYGGLIIDQCQKAGVDMRSCLKFDDGATSTYLSVLNADSNMHVAINDMAILEKLNSATLQKEEEMLRRASLIVIDTNLSENALEYLFSNFSGIPIFVDTVSCAKALKIKPYLSSIHTLKPNLHEALMLAGMEIEGSEQLPILANWFHQQGVKRLFISLGEEGAFYSDGKEQKLMPAKPTLVTNVNGAGDAFVAALAHSWIRDWSIEPTTEFAMAAASIALSHLDTINPNMSEISVNRTIKGVAC